MVLMGVAGCGKTTIGEALAKRIGCVFLDGDRFHPEANVAKMSRGEPLTDADRWPWLETIACEMAGREGMVAGGCSALKRAYRQAITTAAGEPVLFIHLAGSRALIEARMQARTGHFMPVTLLDSQFSALEPPGEDENAIAVAIARPADEIVSDIAVRIQRAT